MTAYLNMLPRLMAEESLAAAARTAIGTGHVTAQTRARLVGEWERIADGRTPAPGSGYGPVFPRYQGPRG